MSLEYDVAIMAGTATRDLLPVVENWARNIHPKAAGFDMVNGGSMAAYADVIVGQVNYLDADALKAVIRDAVKDAVWGRCEPVGLTVHCRDAESVPTFSLLDSRGVWS